MRESNDDDHRVGCPYMSVYTIAVVQLYYDSIIYGTAVVTSLVPRSHQITPCMVNLVHYLQLHNIPAHKSMIF